MPCCETALKPITNPCQDGTSDIVLYVPCFGVSFCTVSPSMCLDDIYLGLGSWVATIRESPAHSVNRLFSLLCLFVALVVSHFGFEGRTLGLSVLVHGHCLPFTFLTLHRIKNKTIVLYRH